MERTGHLGGRPHGRRRRGNLPGGGTARAGGPGRRRNTLDRPGRPDGAGLLRRAVRVHAPRERVAHAGPLRPPPPGDAEAVRRARHDADRGRAGLRQARPRPAGRPARRLRQAARRHLRQHLRRLQGRDLRGRRRRGGARPGQVREVALQRRGRARGHQLPAARPGRGLARRRHLPQRHHLAARDLALGIWLDVPGQRLRRGDGGRDRRRPTRT